MNAPFVIEQARALAALPDVAAAPMPEARIAALYRRVLGRSPTRPSCSAAPFPDREAEPRLRSLRPLPARPRAAAGPGIAHDQ